MDELDRSIISMLINDGKTSNAAIARQVGVSEETIRRHKARLMQEGVIRISAVPDAVKMGYRFEVLVAINFKSGRADDVADVDIRRVVDYHKSLDVDLTLTGVQPFSSYGTVECDERGVVTSFQEKPQLPMWVNGGFMVARHEILDHLPAQSSTDELSYRLGPGLAPGDQRFGEEPQLRPDGKQRRLCETNWRHGNAHELTIAQQMTRSALGARTLERGLECE